MLESESRNIKTIIFSELPKAEKTKFFNILLENDINFTRDEKGYYVAVVKVLNPAFHGEINQNNHNVNNLKSNQCKRTQGNQNNLQQQQQVYQSTPLKNEKDKKQRSTSQSGINSNINKGDVYNSAKAPMNNQILTPGVSENTPRILNKAQINKIQSEKIKESFKKPSSSAHEIFNGRYKNFLNALNPLIGVRGKKMNLFQLKYYMEEIYSIRFIKDTSTLRNQLLKNNKMNGDFDMKDPFPSFVVEFLANKYVKKPMIDQHALDILISSDYFKTNSKEIKIFSKFLNEEYDTDDLIFFLFVRSCIEKEMKIMFIEKAKEEIKLQQYEDKEKIDTELYLNIKTCFRIANTIFGNEEEILLNSFMEKIEQNLISSQKLGKNMIAASSILEITLEDYHQSRQMYSNDKSNVNLERFVKKNNDNENLFEEFEVDTNEYKESKDNSRKINFNKFPNKSNSLAAQVSPKIDGHDKVNNIKSILSAYIKEKELDIFFEKLMASYSLNEKDSDNVELIMSTIKELVTKKLGLLINIIFSQDQKNWFSSLKIRDEDQQSQKHFQLLVKYATQLVSIQEIEDIPLELVEDLCQTLLSTPELNNQIHKLVLKHFS